jgi:hypothetical protein
VRPFSARLFPDTVQVVPPVDGQDADGGPTRGDGTPVTFSASVQEVTSTGISSHRVEPFQGTVAGETHYEVLFPQDPGIAGEDVKLLWTANKQGPINPPIVLASQGAARPPRGLGVRWTVSAIWRS